MFVGSLAMHLLSTKPSANGIKFGYSLKLTIEAINEKINGEFFFLETGSQGTQAGLELSK